MDTWYEYDTFYRKSSKSKISMALRFLFQIGSAVDPT